MTLAIASPPRERCFDQQPMDGDGSTAHDGTPRVPSDVVIQTLDPAAPDWERLVAGTGPLWDDWKAFWASLAADERDPATHPAWVVAWLARAVRNGRRVRLVFARRDGVLVAAAAFEVLTVPTLVGHTAILALQDEVPMEGASLAARRDELAPFLAALFNCRIDGPQRPAMIVLGKVDASHALLGLHGSRCRVEPDSARSVITLPDDPAGFAQRIGSNLRGNLRKARNKLERFPDARIESLTGADGVRTALAHLADVEARSWKAGEGTDFASDASVREFLAHAAPLLAADGCALGHVLHADGRVIGVQLSVVFAHELHVHKIAFDQAYSECAPGNLLLQHLLEQHAPAVGITRVNLVTHLPWHERWKPEVQPTFAVRVFSPGLRGRWNGVRLVPLRRRVGRWLRDLGLRPGHGRRPK